MTAADAIPAPIRFNVADYVKKVFEMHDGEKVTIDFERYNSLMKILVDRFGEDIDIREISDNTFKDGVNVSTSKDFYRWIFQFGGMIKIMAPLLVKNEYKKMVDEHWRGKL